MQFKILIWQYEQALDGTIYIRTHNVYYYTLLVYKVKSEHIKHGGPNLIRIITMQCNRITCDELVPSHHKKGLIVPIPTGTKDQTVPDNRQF